VANLHAKFEVSSFNPSRDIERGTKISKSRSHDPFTTLFDLILHYSFRSSSGQSACQIWVSSFNRFCDMEGVPKF